MRMARWLFLTVVAGVLALVLAPALVAAVGPDSGYLEVCKASDGSGVSGTFRFTVGAQSIAVPVDACSAPLQLPVGPVTVTEEPVPGVAVASIAVTPVERQVSVSLPDRSAQVNVVAGGVATQSIVTFTNRSEMGILTVCKAAGAGIAPGTNFTFVVAGRSIAVPAGGCREAGTFPYGTLVTVTEVSESTTRVLDIGVIPPNRMVGAPSLTDGVVTVAIGPLVTQVTFTNEVRPLGSLQICKRSGATSVTGTYTFTAAAHRVEVPVGLCSEILRVPEGVVTVSEVQRADTRVAGIATAPASRLVRTDLAGGTAQVEILAGNLAPPVTVTFTNELQTGQVKVCKVAGTGVTLGAPFSFSVASQTVSVPAGSCALAGSFPIGTLVTVAEAVPAGMHVAAINVAPADRVRVAPSLTNGSVTVITGAGVTEVTVTNQSVTQPTLPTTTSTAPALVPPTTAPVTIPPVPTTVPMSTTSTVRPTTVTTVPILATTSTTAFVPVATSTTTTVPLITTATTAVSIAPTTTTVSPATTSTTSAVSQATSTTVPVLPATSTTVPVATIATTSSVPSTSTTVPATVTPTTIVPVVGTSNTVVFTSQTTIPVGPCVPPTTVVPSSTSPTVPIAATTTTFPATGQTTTTASTPPGVDMTNSCELTSSMSTPTTIVGRLLDRVTVPLTTARLAVTGLGTSLLLALAFASIILGAMLLIAPRGLVTARPGSRSRRLGQRAPLAAKRWDALSRTPRLRRRRLCGDRSRNVWRR